MAKPHTKRDEVFEYLSDYIDIHGFPPSIREIGAGVRLKSPSSVYFHLRALEEEGRILLGRNLDGMSRMNRAIRIVQPGEEGKVRQPVLVPVIKDPSKPGKARFDEPNILAYTDFCRFSGGYKQGDYVLCVGTSRVSSHIQGLQKEDYVLIRPEPLAGPPTPVLINGIYGPTLISPAEANAYPAASVLGYALCMQRNF